MNNKDWLLTDEEMTEAVQGEWNASHWMVAKAAQKKLLEWLGQNFRIKVRRGERMKWLMEDEWQALLKGTLGEEMEDND